MNDYLITLDVDWASDEVIAHCAEVLIERGVKATWLVTHDSAQVRELMRNDLFEVGLHPNFLAGSTQGGSPTEVLDYLCTVAPGARTVRTHDLFQSTRLLRTMCEQYGLCQDLSLLLPHTPNIVPHEFHLERVSLVRCPTFWADDVEMLCPRPSFSFDDSKFHVPGLKIFLFHPIHVALNAHTLEPYRNLKAGHEMSRISLGDLQAHVDATTPGTGTLFTALADFIARGSTRSGMTVSELVEKWRARPPAGAA